MSGSIKDGSGSGKLATVDNHGRLLTRSHTIGHMSHHATTHKNAYIKVMETTFPDANQTVCALLYNNDPTTELEVYWVKLSSDSSVEMTVRCGNTYTSGGTAVEFVNTHLGAVNDLNIISYEGGSSGDMIVDTTVNVEIDALYLKSYEQIDGSYDGGIIIPYKQSISFKAAGVANDKVKVTIGFAVHSKGTEL